MDNNSSHVEVSLEKMYYCGNGLNFQGCNVVKDLIKNFGGKGLIVTVDKFFTLGIVSSKFIKE